MPPAVQFPHQHGPDGCAPRSRRAPVRATLRVAVCAAAAVTLLSACGNAGGATGAAAAPAPSATSTSGTQGGAGQGSPGQGGPGRDGRDGGMSGASGLLAALDGKTLQVQGNQTQTAVTWSASTAFTQTRKTTAAAVKVGSWRGGPRGGTARHPGHTVSRAAGDRSAGRQRAGLRCRGWTVHGDRRWGRFRCRRLRPRWWFARRGPAGRGAHPAG